MSEGHVDISDFSASLTGSIYDKIEDRFGRIAAWLATLALGVALMAALLAIFIVVLKF